MNNNTDLGSIFDKWVDDTWIPYKGVLLERLPNGYKCMGVFCLSLQDVDRVLSSGRSALSNSISSNNKQHK